MKFNVLAFALAGGILWAVAMLIIGLLSTYTGYTLVFEEIMATVYIGYSSTFWGSIVGAIWGFVDAFIFCAIFAWLYNSFDQK